MKGYNSNLAVLGSVPVVWVFSVFPSRFTFIEIVFRLFLLFANTFSKLL